MLSEEIIPKKPINHEDSDCLETENRIAKNYVCTIVEFAAQKVGDLLHTTTLVL